jgi:Mn2+/Fe2+ NRAMP family transporter
MSEQLTKAERDRQRLIAAQQRGVFGRCGTYFRLSGPGWIASAITLGGGSLASSLYLGVLGGYSLMWLQPFAMILGLIMLGAIGYVTLSTGERPFPAINDHVNPVLGLGWALAVAAANIVWCMPQFALANGVLTQNLLPEFLSAEGPVVQWACNAVGTNVLGARMTLEQGRNAWAWIGLDANPLLMVVTIFLVCTLITWSYDRGGWGLRLYETVLKIVVAIIVLCFIGVVIKLSFSSEPLDWAQIGQGLIPDFTQMFHPAQSFLPLLESLGAEDDPVRKYWTDLVIGQQRDVMIAAAATAVGINMTFMFPYTMLRKGWTKEFRGLSIFDLSTGMFIPYILATGCVVIASASRFHGHVAEGFVLVEEEGTGRIVSFEEPDMSAEALDELALNDRNRLKGIYGKYERLIAERQAANLEGELSVEEKRVAATLVKRDAMNLAQSLSPLTGDIIANYVFGLGVLAMVLSTISILMLISGFVFTEVLALPEQGWGFRIGTLLAGVGGVLGPFIWGTQNAQFYLAVPTSVFGFILLPFAYVTFVLVMNSKSLLGDERPRGLRRFVWTVLTVFAAAVASAGALIMMWYKAKMIGIVAIVAFVTLAVMVAINRYNTARQKKVSTDGEDRDS